jgi:hypothetical protein
VSALAASPHADGPLPAGLDTRRPRLVLPRYLVPVGLFLLERRNLPSDHDLASEVDELERAGIVQEGRLHPVARRILAPVADPALVVSVEMSTTALPEISTIWRAGSGATLGTSLDHTVFELHPVEPDLLPFHLAAITRLRDRLDPAREIISIDAEVFDAARRAAAGDPEALRRGLHGQGVPAADAGLVARLHTEPGRRWQISTLRTERDGTVSDGCLSVIDGGEMGYWEVARIATDHRVAFSPRSTAGVLRLMADLTLG